MKTRIEEIETEATIYAAGTHYTRRDLVEAYLRHESDCEKNGHEPENVQTFFELMGCGD